MGRSPHKLVASNDPNNTDNTKVWPPVPTPHIKNLPTTMLEASCLKKRLFKPSCHWPSRPGRICTEPSRAGVRCKGPTFQGVMCEGQIVICQIVIELPRANKLINLIEWTFKREGSPYNACNERRLSSLLETHNHINFGLVKTCVKP